MRAVTLITGASTGIGAGLARTFARHGHDLVIVARREAQLASVAAGISAESGVDVAVLPFDLSAHGAPVQLEEALRQRGLEPDFVVNNAGFGVMGLAGEKGVQEQLAMVDVNVRAVTDLSLRFLESVTRHRGGIINVASIAGLFPGPGMAVYYASKAYILSFTEALSRELAPKGVRVSALCPGPVKTELHDRAGIPVKGHVRLMTTSVEQVAEEAYAGLIAGKRVIFPGLAAKILGLALPRLPRTLLMSLTRSSVGLTKKSEVK